MTKIGHFLMLLRKILTIPCSSASRISFNSNIIYDNSDYFPFALEIVCTTRWYWCTENAI